MKDDAIALLGAIQSIGKDEIESLFAADTVLKRIGFPEEAKAVRGIAALALLVSSTNRQKSTDAILCGCGHAEQRHNYEGCGVFVKSPLSIPGAGHTRCRCSQFIGAVQ
jgi:hypothetical protein